MSLGGYSGGYCIDVVGRTAVGSAIGFEGAGGSGSVSSRLVTKSKLIFSKSMFPKLISMSIASSLFFVESLSCFTSTAAEVFIWILLSECPFSTPGSFGGSGCAGAAAAAAGNTPGGGG